MGLYSQVWTLVDKNLRIALYRHLPSTLFRAFILPVIFIIFISYARNFFIPPAHYGIGTPAPVKSLADALNGQSSGRDTVVFVNNGLAGGEIDRVIDEVSSQVTGAGKQVKRLTDVDELLNTCPSSLIGVSTCFAGAVFYASPDEGPGGMWNYTIRVDGALGTRIDVREHDNDAQIYVLPFQHAVDYAIAGTNSSTSLPPRVMEYPYTSKTQKQRNDNIRVRYMSGIEQILAVAFFLSMVGIIYHLVGFMATEREIGMSQLVEAMMPNIKRWQPQLARLLSYHLAFDLIYLPGWIIIGIVLSKGVFSKTNAGIVIIFHLLSGLSLASFSLFGSAFFKKAQLSGISMTIGALILGIVAQVAHATGTGGVAVLSLLFPPMTYTYFTIMLSRFEHNDIGASLTAAPPEGASTLPSIVLWIFLILQIFYFIALAAVVERSLYGTASEGRNMSYKGNEAPFAVSLAGFTKRYAPRGLSRRLKGLFGKVPETVTAVDSLTLDARKGQVVVLLGANGSGKTTTLEAVAGLNTVTEGTIDVDGTGGLGICPQKNVMWDDLTVEEHVSVFNRIKNTAGKDTKAQIRELITACDLDRKIGARSKTLSGGQKRKLQLTMMFTGGSKVCCVDEVSSGLDPLSRRKIWDILLGERGARTILLTTHFLDEADILADHIAILSKGVLKTEGSSVELKHKLGGGYRVHVYAASGTTGIPVFEGIARDEKFDRVTYTVADSSAAAKLVNKLEESGIKEYQVSGPTIEDVFLKLAEEVRPGHEDAGMIERPESNESGPKSSEDDVPNSSPKDEEIVPQNLQLLTGRRIGIFRQMTVLFGKRITILRRNYLPHSAAFLIPIIAAGLVTLFLKGFNAPSCNPGDNVSRADVNSLSYANDIDILAGPESTVTDLALARIFNTLPESKGAGSGTSGGAGGGLDLLQDIHRVSTLKDFNDQIDQRFANITPGGFYTGSPGDEPTIAYLSDAALFPAMFAQNALDTLLTNVSISTQYSYFDKPWQPDAGKSLQLIVYFCLAMAAYPAFFGLYPTVERLHNIRALHYSNGVRSLPLWTAYLSFDFCIVAVTSAIALIIFATTADVWYNIGYLFVVLLLYGVASTLLSYVISLFAGSQLAAFAFSAAGQAVMFLLWFIAYLSIQTYSPAQRTQLDLKIAHFTISSISPSCNLVRALFVALNVFTTACDNKEFIAYPGDILAFGGPILYLSVQSIFLFSLLLWWDSGFKLGRVGHKERLNDEEEKDGLEREVAEELHRVTSSNDGLRLVHVSKAFGSNKAVQDVTFGVPRGEVFALLGPNGAGKSTTISLIRGDIQPARRGGDIFVENVSMTKHRAAGRAHLGVCPQFDAMDQMTVLEHLQFYARIRGVPEIEHNVREVIRAVGLQSFSSRMAAKLSGGNKRKLSLGVALMGNPSVLLLDEPSCGMDAAAKRVMWKTLTAVVPGRSIVLTTHSMEEADALADRAGIMSRRMLALGTPDYLRRKHGNEYHIHLIMRSGAEATDAEMERVKAWIQQTCPGARVEQKVYHGQIKFSVPVSTTSDADSSMENEKDLQKGSTASRGISSIFTLLEENKDTLGLEYYSVSQTTLDQVFLSIVGSHNVEEENYAAAKPKEGKTWTQRLLRR